MTKKYISHFQRNRHKKLKITFKIMEINIKIHVIQLKNEEKQLNRKIIQLTNYW